jgi:preprotein translocase subunit SecD
LLKEAQQMIADQNYKGAMAKLDEAEAVKSNPDDETVINQMRKFIAVKSSQSQTSTQMTRPRFAIRVVDESVGEAVLQRPVGDDRVQIANPGKGMPAELWLKREGQMQGDSLADAKASIGQNGTPIIEIQLTARGRDQFASLTQANVGHKIAFVMNGKVITAPLILNPIQDGKGYITGNFASEAEAQAVVAEMMGPDLPSK